MSEEEIKKYVEEMCKNIINLLGNHEEELDFVIELIETFNQVCEEKNKLEQQVEKQKEVIDKMNKLLRQEQDAMTTKFHYDIVGLINELLDILSEGKNE